MYMQAVEQLNYPLPIIKVDTERIVVKITADCEGEFTIRNEGGGTLAGKIASNFNSIKLTPEEFSGNRITVKYKFMLDSYKQGDVIQTYLLIISNGGEVQIPIVIKITNNGLIAKTGESLLSLKEFAQYAKKHPLEAKRLFISHEFITWLSHIGYEHMEMLDNIIEDSNGDRALDNFLTSSKQKRKATVEVEKNIITVERLEGDSMIITSNIAISKVGWGYLDMHVIGKNSAPWLNIITKKVTSSMFKNSDEAFIVVEIDTSKIRERLVCEELLIGMDIQVKLHVKCKKKLSFSISKICFENEDSGELIVENKTGKDLMIGVHTSTNYVKFAAKSYMVGEYAKIPFQIKINTLQNAQLAIKKQPTAVSDIAVKTIVDDKVFKQNFELLIGNLLNKVSFL